MRFRLSRLYKFGKYKVNQYNTFQSFSFCLELWMNYAPLTWYEQEYLTYKVNFEALSIAPFSLRLVSLKV